MTDLKRILDLIRADEKAQSRQLLLELLKTDRRNEQAWLYLALCATNKREFEASIQQVLKLNPRNAIALKQAQKHGIPIPEAAKQVQQASRKAARKSRGRRWPRVLLLLLLTLLGVTAAFVLLNGDDVGDEGTEVEALATSEATQEATVAPTEEATAEATAATEEAILIPTAEITEETTAEAANSTVELPILPSVQAYVEKMTFLAEVDGTLQEASTAPDNAPIAVEIRLRDHGEPLKVSVVINSRGGNENITIEEEFDAQVAHSIQLPVKTADELWASGIWVAQLNLNDQQAFLAEIFIIPAPVTASSDATEAVTEESATQEVAAIAPTTVPAQTATPAITATSAISPTPTLDFPDTEASLRLVYTPDAVYLLNLSTQNLDISGLRFVQNLTGGDQVAFNTTEWELTPGAQGAGTIYQFQPSRCFQIGTTNSSAQQKAPECTVLNAWQVRDLDGQFWLINNGNIRTFLILQNGIPLAECKIDDGQCEFGLLPQ